jgi:hypothetical protein
MKRRSLSFLVTAALFFVNSRPILADPTDVDYTPAAVTADILIARPLCFVVTAIGTGLFVATLPITVLCGGAGASAKALVATPAKQTFVRKLGNLSGLEE